MSEQQRRNAVQILLTLDKKDYEEGMPVFEKYSTRGVIIRDGKIATQHGSMFAVRKCLSSECGKY